MTLLDDICGVHDGVLKAPPLRAYESGTGRIRENSEHIFKNARTVETDHEDIYKKALTVAIEAVRIMQLSSKNIEKERNETDYCEEVRRFMVEYSKLNGLQMPPSTNHRNTEASLCDVCGVFNECGGQDKAVRECTGYVRIRK